MRFSELIAIYLFLGGTSAGAFAVLATFDVVLFFQQVFREGWDFAFNRRPDHLGFDHTYRRVRRIVYATALIVIVAGLLCLIADLGRPEAFYYLMIYPTTSLVSIGALALSLLTVSIVASLTDTLLALPRTARKITLWAKVVGIPIAGVVMVYTGLLLQSVISVKFWSSLWLPMLFLASASSCGCAVVMIGLSLCEDLRATCLWERPLVCADLFLVIAEAVLTVLLFTSVSEGDSSGVGMAITGAYSLQFWFGFVVCGLVVPLMVESFSAITRKKLRPQTAAAVAIMVLAGGLCLRLVIVACGVAPVD